MRPAGWRVPSRRGLRSHLEATCFDSQYAMPLFLELLLNSLILYISTILARTMTGAREWCLMGM